VTKWGPYGVIALTRSVEGPTDQIIDEGLKLAELQIVRTGSGT
jgi:hypothetical protein